MNYDSEEQNPELQRERAAAELRELARQLGFVESERLLELRRQLKESPDQGPALVLEWQASAETLIDAITDAKVFNRAQLGMIICHAALLGEHGYLDEYEEAIYQARLLAVNLSLEEISNQL